MVFAVLYIPQCLLPCCFMFELYITEISEILLCV